MRARTNLRVNIIIPPGAQSESSTVCESSGLQLELEAHRLGATIQVQVREGSPLLGTYYNSLYARYSLNIARLYSATARVGRASGIIQVTVGQQRKSTRNQGRALAVSGTRTCLALR